MVKNQLQYWIQASRPFTLGASLIPVLLGSVINLHWNSIYLFHTILILLAATAVQIGTNLVDEYSDETIYKRNVSTLPTYKVISLGIFTAKTVKIAALISFSFATIIGLYFIITSTNGLIILAICIISVFVAYNYAGEPLSIGNKGFGWPLVFLFMGPILTLGTEFTLTNAISSKGIILSLCSGSTATIILIANDLRDYKEDITAKKITPITILGQLFGKYCYFIIIISPYIFLMIGIILLNLSQTTLITIITIPMAIINIRNIWKATTHQDYFKMLKNSAIFHTVFGIFILLGLLVNNVIT